MQLLRKGNNLNKIATNQRLKLKRCVAFAHIISRNILIRVKKHSDKSIAQATVFKNLTVAVSSKGFVLLQARIQEFSSGGPTFPKLCTTKKKRIRTQTGWEGLHYTFCIGIVEI